MWFVEAADSCMAVNKHISFGRSGRAQTLDTDKALEFEDMSQLDKCLFKARLAINSLKIMSKEIRANVDSSRGFF